MTLRFTSDRGPEPERFESREEAAAWVESMTRTGPLSAEWDGDTVIFRSTYSTTLKGVVLRLEEVDA